jgi:hypothetical protein
MTYQVKKMSGKNHLLLVLKKEGLSEATIRSILL